MKLLKLTADSLHGYLSFVIPFDKSLTFLVGINGSGKTSAVRSIMAILTPALRDLVHLSFAKLAIELEHGGEPVEISATRSAEDIALTITGSPGQLKIPIVAPEQYELPHHFRERELSLYRELEVTVGRDEIFRRISAIPTPMFLDLERRAQINVRRRRPDDLFLVRRYAAPPTVLAGSLAQSLDDARAVAEEAFRHNLARQKELTDGLKQELILAAFTRAESPKGVPLPTVPTLQLSKQATKAKDLVYQTLQALGVPLDSIDQHVRPFFDDLQMTFEKLSGAKNLKRLMKEDPGVVSRWFELLPQLDRINGITRLVERYNQEVEGVLSPISKYLDLVNRFLNDSGKEARFSPTGHLRISIAGTTGDRPITALSSGEQQLVVILTHMAFNPAAKRANVLIIDEPELSLHIRWQEQFVGALEGTSEGFQLILATHSPSIVMDRVDNCVDVGRARV